MSAGVVTSLKHEIYGSFKETESVVPQKHLYFIHFIFIQPLLPARIHHLLWSNDCQAAIMYGPIAAHLTKHKLYFVNS